MAEALAAVGIVSSIASLVDISAKIVTRLNEFQTSRLQVPKTFRSLAEQLPFLTQTLEIIKDRAQNGYLQDEEAKTLQRMLDSVASRLYDLQRFLDELIPEPNASRWRRALKGVKSIAKEDELNQAVANMHRDIDSVMLHQTTMIANTGDRILQEVYDFKQLELALAWANVPKLSQGLGREHNPNTGNQAVGSNASTAYSSAGVGKSLTTNPGNVDKSRKQMDASTTFRKELHALHERTTLMALRQAYKTIDDWLGVVKVDQGYDKYIADRLEGTCKWILQHPAYAQWISPEFDEHGAKFLWINGPAGFGKTTLSASLVQHLQSFPSILPLVYFFSTNHVQAGGSLDGIVKSLLSQLTKVNTAAFELIYNYVESESAGQVASHTKVWDMFEIVLSTINGGVLLVDGLDEYPASEERKDFLRRLKTAAGSNKVRCLVTSRPETDIESELSATFDSATNPKLIECKLSEKDVGADVLLYSNKVVEQQLPKKDGSLRQELAAGMAAKCEGMFLWIKLQKPQLRDGKSRKGLKAIVDSMPSGLHQSYERNWASIQKLEEDDRNHAISILRWITFARRPLTVAELSEALLIDRNLDSTTFPLDDMPDAIDDDYIETVLKELCGSFIDIRDGTAGSSPCFRLVQTVHASVQQFLFVTLPLPLSMDSLPSESRSHIQETYLAKVCVRYLNFEEVWGSDKWYEGEKTGQAFLDYATNFWYMHAEFLDKHGPEVSRCLKEFFASGNKNFEAWADRYEPAEHRKDKSAEKSWAGLYYAALFGLASTMQLLHDQEKIDVNQKGQRYGTALEAACSSGEKACYDTLISWGADINIKDGEFGTALNTASARGSDHIVQDLLTRGADLSVPDNKGSTALHLACQFGRRDVVSLLLKAGAETNSKNDELTTPLHAAAGEGYLEIVKDLLKNKAQTGSITKSGATPLYTATRNGHLEVVKEFLSLGVDASTLVEGDTTPVYAAAFYGHVEVLKALLDYGADYTTCTRGGASPLYVAAAKGWPEVMKVLINHGADFKATDEKGWTIVNAASSTGFVDIVRELIKRGADFSVQNSLGMTPLYSAAMNGHTKVVKELLDHGADLSVASISKWTPLNAACGNGHLETVIELLDHKADFTIANDDGMTPVYTAALNGHIKVVKELLSRGASISITNINGWTPVNAASEYGHTEVVKELIQNHGADFTTSNSNGWTPVHTAACKGHLDIVKELLDRGADLSVANKDGWTPLCTVAEKGHIEIVRELLDRGADLSVPNNHGWTPINIAASHGQLEVLREFIKRGADFSVKNDYGWTPVNTASENGHLEVIKELHSHGADLSTPNNEGWAPLNTACSGGHLNVVKFFLDNGMDLSITNKKGWTPLNSAAEKGHLDIMKELLDRGADKSIPNTDGWTPLNIAANNGQLEVVKYLLDLGDDLSTSNFEGWTPINAAASTGYVEIVRELQNRGADMFQPNNSGWTPLNSAADNGHLEVVKYLLDQGADLSVSSTDKWTPINAAANNGHLEVVKELLERGADLTITNTNRWTPLNSAASNGHLEIVQELLSRGADLAATNIDGWTPLNTAAGSGHLEVVKVLMKAGADIATPNNNGWTPLNTAAESGQVEVVKELLKHGADASIANDDKMTPLSNATEHNHLEVMKELLNHGADVNTIGTLGQTPLIRDVVKARKEECRLLIQFGADATIVDNYGRSAIDWLKILKSDRELLESICDKPDLPAEQDLHRLKKSLADMANVTIEQVENKVNFFYEIGHCCLMLGDEENASIAFSQVLEPIVNPEETPHPAYCDMCEGSVDIKGDHFACKTCPNSDLCSACMSKYDSGTYLPFCAHHEFLKIPASALVQIDVNWIKTWLPKLVEKFSSEDEH